VLKFFDWSYKNGAGMATELDYVPMPPATVKLIQESWKANFKDANGKTIW
jgi:phosphate transport system substrate-binding protein